MPNYSSVTLTSFFENWLVSLVGDLSLEIICVGSLAWDLLSGNLRLWYFAWALSLGYSDGELPLEVFLLETFAWELSF